ncbi:MAG: hypothetical protein JKY34_08800 [Kordiimonadaceae bacterium]|nr:hypothetical protein [Kordiimonadaceae bacterium]
MPEFLSQGGLPVEGLPGSTFDPVHAPLPQTEEVSFADTAKAAFVGENLIASTARYASYLINAPDNAPDSAFNALSYVNETHDMKPYWREMLGVKNRKRADARAAYIRQGAAYRDILAKSDGLLAFAATTTAVVLSPETWLFMGVSAPGRIGLGAAKAAAASAGVTLASEIALHAAQPTRTPEESALAVGGATLMGGVSGAHAALKSHLEVRDAMTRAKTLYGGKQPKESRGPNTNHACP